MSDKACSLQIFSILTILVDPVFLVPVAPPEDIGAWDKHRPHVPKNDWRRPQTLTVRALQSSEFRFRISVNSDTLATLEAGHPTLAGARALQIAMLWYLCRRDTPPGHRRETV